MTIKLHWFLPTNGDSRRLIEPDTYAPGQTRGARVADLGYLTQIALAAEAFGFEAALTPAGPWCDDAWITTVALAQHTHRLKFLVAFRPGLVSPTLAAQQAASYQLHTGGRLALNVVTGGDTGEQNSYGDWLGKDERYERCDEFLQIVARLWQGEHVDFKGQHLNVSDAFLGRVPDPIPEIYFAGSSSLALDVAAKHSQVYLTWGEPPEQVAEKLERVRERASANGRTVRSGLRIHVISRETSEEAWNYADRLLANIEPSKIRAIYERMSTTESEGQRRMLDLHKGDVGNLEIAPNLWAGVGIARGGAGTALVGSHAEVADRIAEYASAGIDEFILSGYPHLEEIFWFGEGVMPELSARNIWHPPEALAGITTSDAGPGAVPFGVVPRLAR